MPQICKTSVMKDHMAEDQPAMPTGLIAMTGAA
jgi:hypothetical protein